MITTDVLVVGAGPAGLTTAATLVAHGVPVTVVDNQAAGANTSRAAVVHARTLEVLDRLGAAKPLTERGVHAQRFSIRDRDRELVRVPFDHLDTAFPYALMVSQAETEAVLLAKLVELGGDVLRPRVVTDVEQDAEGVTATLDDGSEIRAKYLVGADGLHSTVREKAGIGFTGGSYAESFSLADVRLTGGVPRDEVILYFSPAGMVVVAPLPDGVHRLVATVDEAPEVPDVAFVQRLLDTRGPEAERAVVHEVIWGSRFRVQHRVADRYLAGRIVLAGDAAHVHSPAGGQGMNIGIQDGVALGDALAHVLATGSTEQLDAYEATRRPIAKQVVALADRSTRLATARPWLRPLRNAALKGLARIPAVRRTLALRLSGLVYR